MKRILMSLMFFYIFLLASCSFAETARIIDVKDRVMVKKTPAADWRKAKVKMDLAKDAELKTGKHSQCTLAFDEDLKNIVTVKENSHIKIENVIPGDISLSEGRVFSLIESIPRREKFQIRTPVAIAGARGTGWITSFGSSQAALSCFKDKIFIQGLDNAGNVTKESDLSSGWGVDVGAGGIFGDRHRLSGEDYRQWDEFTSHVNRLSLDEDQVSDKSQNLGDLRGEQMQDFRDIADETRRREKEGSGSRGGGTDGDNQKRY